jgi:hypothetical protein
MEGFDGSVHYVRERQIAGTRLVTSHNMRCKPGTFEWRYGRARPGTELDMLYLAGVEFGRLWERAGMDAPRPVDWGMPGVAAWRGLPDARVEALSELKAVSRDLGKLVMARLVNYVVEGKTPRQIALQFDLDERDMAIVLASDLRAAASYFGFGGRV